MTGDIVRNIIRFFVLVLLQVLIVQNIRLGSYIILLPYVLFILMLPFETPRLTLIGLSFFLGLVIDMFYDTAGMHAAACTLMGFSRYYLLKFIAPRDGYEQGLQPTVDDMGSAWFITYAGILIVVHHLFFFYLEVFRWNEFFRTLFRVILSSMGTFVFVYTIQFLFYKSSRARQ
ncbi:MAG: rod shape-determining protein MreD [Bacteroidia bacterium]